MRLSRASLAFAQRHIQEFYASDFFPDPDEYSAVWREWDQVTEHLRASDVRSLGTSPETMSCAKASGGFRSVHQLQPLDSITYTALIYSIAEEFEAARVSEDEGIACSYRIRLDPDSGTLFRTDGDGYGKFHSRSSDLCDKHDWAMTLDIASFYNHIYIPHIETAIHALPTSLHAVGKALQSFLMNMNEQVAVGIPVGPAASIVVAELILSDIDRFLQAHRLRPLYTRYVDDYRFFSGSRVNLQEIWRDLSDYMYRVHRLTLSTGKCRIMPNIEFRESILTRTLDPAQQELVETLGMSFDEWADLYDDDDDDDDFILRSGQLAPRRAAFQELFGIVLAEAELDIGLARRLLRRARKLRMRVIARPLIENLETLGPVIRDAGLYLDEVLTNTSLATYSDSFGRFFRKQSEAVDTSHMHYWLAWLLSGKVNGSSIKGADAFINRSKPRFRARFAQVRDQASWVRHNRGRWQEWASWDRWSLIRSGSILAAGERRSWLQSIQRSSSSLMDRIIATVALA